MLILTVFIFSYSTANILKPDGLTNVEVLIRVESISAVDEINRDIEIIFNIDLAWQDEQFMESSTDMGKLLHKNFNWDDEQSLGDSSKLWMPDLNIANLKELRQVREVVTFTRNCTVTYSATFSAKIGCNMEYHFYPLDKHECDIMMHSLGYNSDELWLTWDQDQTKNLFHDDVKMQKFYLTRSFIQQRMHIFFQEMPDINYHLVKVELKLTICLKRYFATSFLDSYIPCMSLVILAGFSHSQIV